MNRKICVVGGGRWGKNHIRTLNDMGNLGGIVETNEETYQELITTYQDVKLFSSLEDALSIGFDGFVVATPAETHFLLAKKIMEAGHHVLVEKPFTTKLEDSYDLCHIAKKYNVNLMVGHLLLFHPAFIKIKSMIENGDIGDLQYMYSNRLNLGTIRTHENVFWSFAPHDISLFQYLAESDPIKITSVGNDILQEGVHDTTITSIEYPNKVMGHIFVSWLHPFKEHRFVVIGSKGMIHFEDSLKEKPLVLYNKIIKWNNNSPIAESSDAKEISYEIRMPLKEELNYFVNHLDGSHLDKASGESAIQVIKILTKSTEELFKD